MNQSDKLKEAANPFTQAYLISKEVWDCHNNGGLFEANLQAGAEKILSFAKAYALSKDTEQDREWVSCNERLPEPYQKCLVVRIDNTVHMDIYQMYHGGKCDFLYQVIHWMPLPTPPKV